MPRSIVGTEESIDQELSAPRDLTEGHPRSAVYFVFLGASGGEFRRRSGIVVAEIPHLAPVKADVAGPALGKERINRWLPEFFARLIGNRLRATSFIALLALPTAF